MADIEFFGEIDKNRSGKISSQYPAWYFDSQIEELSESIARKERSIKRGDMPSSEIGYAVSELDKERKKLDKISSSRPKIKGKDKDDMAKVYKEIGGQIAESMFTLSDMKRGTASAHEEARRMVKPIISVDPKLAEACGVKTTDGKVSRNDASKMYKIMGKLIGDNTNVEALRKG